MADNEEGYGRKSGLGWVIVAALIFGLDFFLKFKGLNWESYSRYLNLTNINIWLNSLSLIPLAAYYVFILRGNGRTGQDIFKELLSAYLPIVLITSIFTMGYFDNNPLAITLHIILALSFYFGIFLKQMDRVQANLFLFGLIFVDFFLFSILSWNKLIVPIYFFVALAYSRPGRAKSILVFLVLAVYILYFSSTVYLVSGGKTELITGKDVNDFKVFSQTIWGNIKGIGTGVTESYERQKNMTQAMVFGDYYTSQVDNNVQQQLGVSIIEVKSTDPYVYEDEPLSVYARMQAKTLKEEINISNSCYVEDPKMHGETIPDQETISQYEDLIVDCRFDSCTFEPGTRTVYFETGFDFETMSYLRNYFVDRDRLQTMIREDPKVSMPSDLLTLYGIYNTNPIALSTNGPVKIGLELEKTQPVSVDRDRNMMTFRLGITLENNWDGRIRDVNDLIIILPEEMDLELDGSEKGTYCGGYDFEPKTCSDIFGANAEEWCSDSESSIYRINQDGSNLKIIPSGQRGIDLYKSLVCRVSLPKSSYSVFLGNTPVAIKNFKVISKYTYQLKKSLSVTIRNTEYESCSADSGEKETSVPTSTLFKTSDMIGVDKDKDGLIESEDDYYFIKGFKKGADSSWVYLINASNNQLLEQMKIQTFDYYRKLDASQGRSVHVQRPGKIPSEWDSLVFTPNKQLKNDEIS